MAVVSVVVVVVDVDGMLLLVGSNKSRATRGRWLSCDDALE